MLTHTESSIRGIKADDRQACKRESGFRAGREKSVAAEPLASGWTCCWGQTGKHTLPAGGKTRENIAPPFGPSAWTPLTDMPICTAKTSFLLKKHDNIEFHKVNPITRRAVYTNRMFRCELPSVEDTSCKGVHPLLSITGWNSAFFFFTEKKVWISH